MRSRRSAVASPEVVDALRQMPWWPRLTPSMRRVLEGMARLGSEPMQNMTPAQARAHYAAGAQTLELPIPKRVQVQDTQVTARDGAALPLRLYRPEADAPGALPALPVLLYLHGGGFTIGGVDTHDIMCRRMADLSGVVVASLDYRLAPEHRFPTAVHDSWDALHWLVAHSAALGLDATRLAVAGDSAGGTLAAVAALHAREQGLPLKAQVLIYPGATAFQDTDSHLQFADGPVLTEQLITWFFNNYIDWNERTDWRFAPLLADDVDDVAPALFVLAECDALVDEGLAYADRLRMAGVPVELELYPGVTHEFIKMGAALPEAIKAHHAIADFLRQALA